MPNTDLSLSELERFSPDMAEPDDLDQFWRDTLVELGSAAIDVQAVPVQSGLITVRTFDITFAGAAGDPVRAWLHLPADRGQRPLPGVITYLGYSGGRGLPHEYLLWASAGYANLVVDTRGQGWGDTVGDTADPHGGGPAEPGFMTRGIADPAGYYYRRAYVDAVRAVEVLRSRPEVDAARVAVTGRSQGGGLSLAVGSLVPGLAAVMADVPFLCNFARAVRISADGPYLEIADFLASRPQLVQQVLGTLSYFDVANLARRGRAPLLMSLAMMDDVCPPSTGWSAYQQWAGPKSVRIYEFNDHRGGRAHQQAEQLRWLATLLAG